MANIVIYQAHALDELRFVDKVGKYVATIQFKGKKKKTFWLSRKQADKLDECFGGDIYASKGYDIYIALDLEDENKPRFVWSAVNSRGEEFLVKAFNATVATGSPDFQGDVERRDISLKAVVKKHRLRRTLFRPPIPGYDYQDEAFDRLRRTNVFALFMDCRAGKTKIAIDLMSAHLRSRRIKRVIWLCPLGVIPTAKKQWGQYAGVPNWTAKVTFFGIETLSGCSFERYEKLSELTKDGKTALIVDESHMIKNFRAKRSHRILALGKKCRFKGILSGTPITRNIEDIYTQIKFLDVDILGYDNHYQFAKHHLIYDKKYPGIVRGTFNVDYISERITPFVFEFFNEPDGVQYQNVHCEPSPEQMELYDEIKTEMIYRLESYENESHDIYLLFSALQSVLSGFVSARVMKNIFGKEEDVVLPSPKLTALEDARQTVDGKAIIWCTRLHEIDLIKSRIPDAMILDGSINYLQRHEIVQAFRQSERGTLVAMIPVAKRGIDIYECDHSFFYGQSFDYESRVQAAARIRLPGKEATCFYYDMIYSGTIDERIQDSHYRKTNIIREFVGKLKTDKKAALEELKKL